MTGVGGVETFSQDEILRLRPPSPRLRRAPLRMTGVVWGNGCSELCVFQAAQEERIEQEFKGAVGLGAVLCPEAD